MIDVIASAALGAVLGISASFAVSFLGDETREYIRARVNQALKAVKDAWSFVPPRGY